MFDDSIFFLFFDIIKDFFKELIKNYANRKNTSLLKKIILTAITLLIGLICIATVITIFFITIYIYIRSKNIIQSVIITIVSLIIVISIILFLLIAPKYLMYFDTFENEIKYSKKSGLSKHTVCLILQETNRDCFVLANFDDYIGLRPAVYKKQNQNIGVIDLYQKMIWYKKIILHNYKNNNNNEIRILRIKNKSSKNQMIVFATKIHSLSIYINHIEIPKIDSKHTTGEFSLYGIIEPAKTINCTIVNINGSNYDLLESKATKFIN